MTQITKLNNTQKQYIIYKNIAIESHKQYYIYLLILYYILFVYVVISLYTNSEKIKNSQKSVEI